MIGSKYYLTNTNYKFIIKTMIKQKMSHANFEKNFNPSKSKAASKFKEEAKSKVEKKKKEDNRQAGLKTRRFKPGTVALREIKKY